MAMTVAPERVILRVLQEARRVPGRPITRTELVKLVYMVDYLYAQHMSGQTLSGLDYWWDNHGPNAIGNAIVKRADWMELEHGSIRSWEGVTPFGNSKFLYEAGEDMPVEPIDEGLAEAIIVEVLANYGHLGWKRLTAVAKQTRPVREREQGDRLDLRPTGQINEIYDMIRAHMAEGAYERLGAGKTLAELQRTDVQHR
jgi:hypothetical protein